ncbi:VOC family protein [Amycolatopsis acidiphila]|uniref:VOC family protein n=1 Tax=Amycolatopsis acidiphila TaxID=715473 RepID=A0A558AKG4_9PSEU|nr:VOC family protein [Amycolatopsis acidiphila]TVT24755.1 VOC family protein [Amycolatopsis acidiphila]UIJ62724.1 VOC family protein [Amycolatopsis acidiphila]GHG63806.1 glyoxalase [Amycolatopsis acidiphila]
MVEKTGYEPGTPCWVDLTTPDVEGAARFYSGLFGWEVVDQGPEFGGYRMCHLRGRPVAGLGPAQDPGIPPNWTSYVSVTDADVATKAITAAGGQVFVEPMDIPGSGRMAIFADPAGAAFGVWQAGEFAGAGLVTEPGALCWNELMTRHPEAANSFYQAVFGWEPERQAMGEADYTTWSLAGQQMAGMMPMDDNWPPEVPPHWLAYFAVEDADATVADAAGLGGQVSVPPTDIPVGRFAVVSDPAGAAFGIVRMNPTTTD